MDRNMELASEASWCPLKFVRKKLQSRGESVRLQAISSVLPDLLNELLVASVPVLTSAA